MNETLINKKRKIKLFKYLLSYLFMCMHFRVFNQLNIEIITSSSEDRLMP